MTDKLYNGFREGRMPGDYKPNNQVREMTKEQSAVKWIAERFRQYQKEGYRSTWDEIIQTVLLAKQIEDQELAKERERYDELKAKYDALVMDNMTLEYNAAEAEKHLPDLIKQFVDQERERTAKMVSDLDKLAENYKAEGLYLSWAAIKQITGSYKNNIPPETTGNHRQLNSDSNNE